MNNNRFSLRLLPDEARIHVIKSLDYPELIALSLLSTKLTSLVQSFKMKIKDLMVNVDENALFINVHYYLNGENSLFKIYNDVDAEELGNSLFTLDEIPPSIETSRYFPADRRAETYTWPNPGLSFIRWFEHLRSIFTFSESTVHLDADEEIFDTEAVRNLLPEWKTVSIENASTDYTSKICEVFSACTRVFDVEFIDNLVQFPQKFVIQNYDDLRTSHSFTLDDALISNSLEICLSDFTISHLNRFIRHWIRGSNSRLRRVYMRPQGDISDEKLLKGVQHQKMPENLERIWNVDSIIKGGIDIRNKKGISATLIINRSNFLSSHMFVWNC